MTETNKTFNLNTPTAIIIAGVIIAIAIIFNSNSPISKQDKIDGRLVSAAELERTVILHDWNNTNYNQAGNPEAAITIVEYSDFACPFCAKHWSETLPLIKEQYIDTGLVNYVYKDFPVVGGEMAAQAAHCAGDQGAYWQYHDVLFSRQNQDRALWNRVEIHMDYADFLNLDAEELAQCFTEQRHQEYINLGREEAGQLGGTGTPFFMINNESLPGAYPFSNFEEIIEQILTEA